MADEKAISLDNLQTFKNNCDTAYEPRKNIPTPTTANNGQVLGVTNGVYALQEGGGVSVQLYRHNITIKTKIGDAIYNLTVINKSSTAFTYTSFAQFLQTLGLTSDFIYYECSGAKGSSSGIAIGIYVGLNYILQVKYVIPSASFNYGTAALNADDIFFYDMVKEI